MAQGTTKGVPIDIDSELTLNSDLLVPSQKAIKTYVLDNISVAEANLVHKTGTETIAGLKTFNNLVTINDGLSFIDGKNIIFGTVTGTKIGTATNQKLGFYGATPIVQPTSVTTPQGIATALTNLGLLGNSTIASITLTTTNNSGEASYLQSTNTLNIPNYTLSGLGGVPSSRSLTINGTTYDLSSNRSWNISLSNISDFNIVNPIIDQVLTWNGTKWTNSNSAVVNAGPGVTYFLTNNLAGFGTYEFMSKTPDTNPEDDEFVTVNNNTVLLHEYISDVTFNKTTIDAGIWEFNYFSYVNTLSASFVTDVYKRTSGGTETLLFSVETNLIFNTTIDLINTTTVQPQFICNATDKLVIKISGKTTQTSNVDLHLVHSGTAHYSHFHTPLVIVHNDIAGLQGGTSDQYYHLTQSEYTGTGTGNFVKENSPTLINPNVGTQTQGDNSTKAASTAYVDTAISNISLSSVNYGLIYAVSTGNLFM